MSEQKFGRTDEQKSAVAGRLRDFSGLTSRPVIAQYEVPIQIDESRLAEVTAVLEGIGDGGIIAQGALTASLTWSVTASLPPDADGDIDG